MKTELELAVEAMKIGLEEGDFGEQDLIKMLAELGVKLNPHKYYPYMDSTWALGHGGIGTIRERNSHVVKRFEANILEITFAAYCTNKVAEFILERLLKGEYDVFQIY